LESHTASSAIKKTLVTNKIISSMNKKYALHLLRNWNLTCEGILKIGVWQMISVQSTQQYSEAQIRCLA